MRAGNVKLALTQAGPTSRAFSVAASQIPVVILP